MVVDTADRRFSAACRPGPADIDQPVLHTMRATRKVREHVTIRVGVIGTGMIGSDHASRISTRIKGAAVTAVFDVATERAQQVADEAGATPRGSWEALVEATDVDAVLIASPGDLHPDQAIACIAAGKPVLCEKPLATTSVDAARVLDAESAAGRRFVQVGFMRRYDAGYLDVKQAMVDGAIGEPLLAHAVHRNATVPDFFRGEMSLTDSLVHEFDVFRWLFDAEISAVTVLPVKRSPLAADGMRDPQIVILDMAGGEVVTVESFVNCQYGYDVRCEIVGSTGTVSLDNPRTAVLVGDHTRAERVPSDWRERFAPAYLHELQTWIDGLADGQVAGPSAWDGYAATAVAEAAVASFTRSERVPVRLDTRPKLFV